MSAAEKESDVVHQCEAFGCDRRRLYRPQNELQNDFKMPIQSIPMRCEPLATVDPEQFNKKKHKRESDKECSKVSVSHEKVHVGSGIASIASNETSTDELNGQFMTLDINGREKKQALKYEKKRKEKIKNRLPAGAENRQGIKQVDVTELKFCQQPGSDADQSGMSAHKPRKVCQQPGSDGGGMSAHKPRKVCQQPGSDGGDKSGMSAHKPRKVYQQPPGSDGGDKSGMSAHKPRKARKVCQQPGSDGGDQSGMSAHMPRKVCQQPGSDGGDQSGMSAHKPRKVCHAQPGSDGGDQPRTNAHGPKKVCQQPGGVDESLSAHKPRKVCQQPDGGKQSISTHKPRKVCQQPDGGNQSTSAHKPSQQPGGGGGQSISAYKSRKVCQQPDGCGQSMSAHKPRKVCQEPDGGNQSTSAHKPSQQPGGGGGQSISAHKLRKVCQQPDGCGQSMSAHKLRKVCQQPGGGGGGDQSTHKPRKVCQQPDGGGGESGTSEQLITLDILIQNLELKKKICLGKHKEDISRLEKEAGVKKKRKHKKKNIHDFSELDKIIEQNKMEAKYLKQAMDESIYRKEVFLQFCTELEKQIQEFKPVSNSTLLGMTARFERECNRYDNALPIYAYRLEIMKTVMDYQVCVVKGETGSGKSTQIVQYLWEAGLASDGRKIACTQPRKLAAMSLADHVSKEVHEQVGKTYGCITTGKGKACQNAEVLFMTDHTLLNECIADPKLSKFSCLVIDEAHERSIHTDILIAFIKRCLPTRPDLKVIITSATINPTLFSYYFGGLHKCPVITVPGRIYPVEVKWNDSGSTPIVKRDYVAEAVQKVHDIHVSNANKSGDILVFLTCPAEIEKACKLAKESLKNKATILPLHGKLQPEEQQKVFEVIKGKRKVVFATNIAETSITIPGISFVIDTGLSKEMCHDPQKNMNSLEIRPISKSSANQRKGRAGRTSPGVCHRLYSEEEYQEMKDDSTPEILRITLAFAIIKLYEFGIEDMHSFEFVESPDRKAINDAIANLKFLGAIEDGKLTELGRKMALIPLEPNLSKVLLDAITAGIGTEAMVAVAVSTLAGRVFFRPNDDESKDISDRKRLPFCHESGDQMTYLHTYHEWSCQERKNQTAWCVENFINAKSMRLVQQLIDELHIILKTKLHINIPVKVDSLAKADDLLPRIFFNAFLQNICIHLGHDKIGYWCENLPSEQLIIYYGSSLHYLSSSPQCVVFEKMQKTTQHFLLQALPVKEEWISDAIKTGQLKCHLAELPQYKLYRVSPIVIPNLGLLISSKLRQRFPQGKSAKFHEFNVQPYFEHLADQGAIKVFLQECYHENIRKSINDFVEPLKKELREEYREHGIVGNNDDVRIVIGVGGCIQHLLMPNDFRSIIVRGFCGVHHASYVEEELKEYGECSSTVMQNQKNTQLLVRYKNPEDASNALSHQFSDRNLTIRQYREKNRNHYSLKVEWWRRRRQDYAFVNFEESIFNLICDFSLEADERHYDSSSKLGFELRQNNCSIKITGIREEMDQEDVISGLHNVFPFLKEALQETPIVYFSYDLKPFDETSENYQGHRECLDNHLSDCVPRTEYFLDFHCPQPKNVKYRAYVQCEDSNTCLMLLQHLTNDVTAFNDEYFMVEMILSSSVRYTSQVFSAVKTSIEKVSLLHSISVSIECDQKDKWGNHFIKVSASEIEAFTKANEDLRRAVEPLTISFDNCKESQYANTSHFREVVKKIQEKTHTYIKINSSSLSASSVMIYGSEKKRLLAQTKLNQHLKSVLQDETDCFEINLRGYGPGLMKQLIVKYGTDIAGLAHDFEGIVATQLNPRKQVLTLFSTSTAHQAFCESLTNFTSPLIGQQAMGVPAEALTNKCCVCFEVLSTEKKTTFFYRLEVCGHIYCRECIKQQLEPRTISFPITCAAENCGEPLVWRDLENLFKHNVLTLRDVTAASLKSYRASNTGIVHNCITPDCDMIYTVSEKGKKFICGQCGANICRRCHVAWHEGYESCDAFKNSGDTELEKWMSEDTSNRKNCPKCSMVIEKNGGCQHVICRVCMSHICWKCLKYFESSKACHDHLSAMCGGIFDAVAARRQRYLGMHNLLEDFEW